MGAGGESESKRPEEADEGYGGGDSRGVGRGKNRIPAG